MDLAESRGGRELGRVEEGETVVGMKEESIASDKKKRKILHMNEIMQYFSALFISLHIVDTRFL